VSERLYRSPSDRAIAGVAGGLGVWLNIDPTLIRIAWVLLAIFSGGIFVLVYIVMMIVVPLPPAGWIPRPHDAGPWAPPPGADPVQGWAPGGGPGPGQDPASTGWNTPPPAWPTPPSGWSGPQTGGSAGLVAGAVLVLLGAWFLVDDYVHIDWNLLWPLAVIAVGGILIVGAIRRGR
jgi:phage shock protein C